MPPRKMLLVVLALLTSTCALVHWLLRDAPGHAPAAHAHNDYQHARPLLDALEHGFTSIEADVWLIDGQLLVAHDRAQARHDRTLDALYLQPLTARTQQLDSAGSLQLLIDIKSEAEPTYRALHALLAAHSGMLTSYAHGRVHAAAISVIVSGNRPRALMLAQELRYAAYDGRLSELSTNPSPAFMPLVSDNWSDHFTWDGSGPQPEGEREKLQRLVRQVHAGGRRLRFWGTPETPGPREAVWQQLRAAGVDYLGSDDLPALQAYLD